MQNFAADIQIGFPHAKNCYIHNEFNIMANFKQLDECSGGYYIRDSSSTFYLSTALDIFFIFSAVFLAVFIVIWARKMLLSKKINMLKILGIGVFLFLLTQIILAVVLEFPVNYPQLTTYIYTIIMSLLSLYSMYLLFRKLITKKSILKKLIYIFSILFLLIYFLQLSILNIFLYGASNMLTEYFY